MRYIKKYENKLYEIGDYVIIKTFARDDIFDITQLVFSSPDDKNYSGKIYFKNGDFRHYLVKEKDIIRKATEEEIRDFNITLDALKYNL